MQVLEDYIPFKFDIIDDISRVDESAQSEVAKSGGTILAIVKGQHFCPGKVSRNHRLYTEELWEAASKDEEVQRKLANGQMFGRVGHEAEITDEDIGAGNYSHITRNIVCLSDAQIQEICASGVTTIGSGRAESPYPVIAHPSIGCLASTSDLQDGRIRWKQPCSFHAVF